MSRLAVPSLVLLLIGCASAAASRSSWPSDFPPRPYYEAVWGADARNQELEPVEEYMSWVARFYRGTMLAPGWRNSEADLEADLAPAEAAALKAKLACLGRLISAEWAKDNRCRRISSEMLMMWARVMKQAKAQGKVLDVVGLLIGDVTGLLSGEIPPAAIQLTRYKDALAGSETVTLSSGSVNP